MGLVLGVLQDVKITHFEPVYVQQIKLLETINYKKYQNIQSLFFIYQNVRITETLTVIPERLRTPLAVIVTAESDLVGSVSRGPPVQEWQLHVHLHTGVALMHPAG